MRTRSVNKPIKLRYSDVWSKEQLNTGKEPENNSIVSRLCRKLIKDGISENTRLELYRDDENDPDLIIPHIGRMGELQLVENSKLGPYYKKHRAMPENIQEKLRSR